MKENRIKTLVLGQKYRITYLDDTFIDAICIGLREWVDLNRDRIRDPLDGPYKSIELLV